ncbi:MAG: methyl-accepting chemotaxis protein [Cyanobacteria bacterium J06621_12]
MSDNTGDIVSKIVEANALESSGEIDQAIALYQEILEQDRDGNYGNVAQQALDNLQQAEASSEEHSRKGEQDSPQKSSSLWSRLSIKGKTSVILIGVALSSSIGIGTVAYILANKTIAAQTNQTEQAKSYELTKQLALFMRDRYSDIEAMSHMAILTDYDLRNNTTKAQKQQVLAKFLQAYPMYNSIAVFDIKGDLLVNDTGKDTSNKKNKPYFKEALRTGKPFIGQPRYSSGSGFFAVYISSRIKDTKTGETVGVIRARIPVENIQNIISAGKSDSAYLLDKEGQIFSTSNKQDLEQLNAAGKEKSAVPTFFDFQTELQREIKRRSNLLKPSATGRYKKVRGNTSVFQSQEEIAYLTSISEINNSFFEDISKLGWSTLVAVDSESANIAQKQLLQVFILGTIISGLVVAALSQLIAERATRPVIEAADAVDKIGQGDLSIKLDTKGEDELAVLSSNINRMAGQIEDLLFTQEAETNQQRREKEALQQGVMGLLLDVEGAQKGDLTVKAQMTDGAIGSIADAFNTTMNKLRGLLKEVQTVSTEVGQLSLAGEDSVRQLSESALTQTAEINQALGSIDEINQSVATVANYAQEAAKIARNGSIQAKEGDLAMDATVNSIEKIRDTVANTSKKVKQLAESSQEIAQIVEIISGISEKTNLLAFNASVEAARAGEHGEGFRIVAEEVRRLADRTTDATKDIQQLVNTIQQDTTSVLQGMETSTSEVVNGSELVHMTKLNLRSLAETSKQIDEYLKYISTSTTDQTNTSMVVNEKISGIATIAKVNSTEAESVVHSLQTLVSEAENLQSSLSQFKLEA